MTFDFLQCLVGLIIGLLPEPQSEFFVGMRLYWKTGHW